MAIDREIVENEADAIRIICEETVKLHARIAWELKHNSNLSIDWAAAEKPEYFTESANGNLDSRPFTRQQVANAVGGLNAIKTLLEGGTVSAGDYLGCLNLVSRPLRG